LPKDGTLMFRISKDMDLKFPTFSCFCFQEAIFQTAVLPIFCLLFSWSF